jgi:hypothetical protein
MADKKKKAAEGAPAYMAQFTALMTIMLAFFIVLQSLGASRVSKYDAEGIGYIRDAFGFKGGAGLLSFMRDIMKSYPAVRKREESGEAELLGYEKGRFEKEILDAEGITDVEILDMGYDIRIVLPAIFEDEGYQLTDRGQQMLTRLGGVLYGLTNNVFTICCMDAGASGSELAKIKSARQAYIVSRFLEERAGIPGERLNAVGCADGRYLDQGGAAGSGASAYLVIRRKNNRARSTVF